MSPLPAAIDRPITMPSASSPEGCPHALEQVEIQTQLVDADAVLSDDLWHWVREIIDAMQDQGIETQSKLFFLQLLRATDREGVDAVLNEMERWREGLRGAGHKRWTQEVRNGVQALFLLGVDKQMSLTRCS